MTPNSNTATQAELSTSQEKKSRLSPRRAQVLWGYLFIAPWIIGFLVFILGPMVASLYLSMTDYNIERPDETNFIGLDHYQRMFSIDIVKEDSNGAIDVQSGYQDIFSFSDYHFTARDQRFWKSIQVTLLLRQYMMGIPLELDEAARVDGANPLQILWHVIVPAARPALVAVYLFHFLWAWNEFQQPLIYIGGNENNQVLAVGLQRFSQIYSSQQNLMMAAAILTMIVPLLIFFLAQRIFMQGVVITGVEK